MTRGEGYFTKQQYYLDVCVLSYSVSFSLAFRSARVARAFSVTSLSRSAWLNFFLFTISFPPF